MGMGWEGVEFYGSLLLEGLNPDLPEGTPDAEGFARWFNDAFPEGRWRPIPYTDAQIVNEVLWAAIAYSDRGADVRRN